MAPKTPKPGSVKAPAAPPAAPPPDIAETKEEDDMDTSPDEEEKHDALMEDQLQDWG